jgi:hypothetical protein
MVSVLASAVVDRGFEPRSDKIKAYEISILLLLQATKYASLIGESTDWLTGNLFQWTSTIKIQVCVLG